MNALLRKAVKRAASKSAPTKPAPAEDDPVDLLAREFVTAKDEQAKVDAFKAALHLVKGE